MAFDPCPAALTANRLASWKFTGQTGAWNDLSTTYSLTNLNTIQRLHADTGEGFIGPVSLCDHTNAEVWWLQSATALMRNGQDFTKCAIVYHRYSDFDAQAAKSTFIGSGADLELSVVRSGVSTSLWEMRCDGSSTFQTRTDAFDEPWLMVAKNDHAGGALTYQVYKLSDSTQVYTYSWGSAAGSSRTTDFYGRFGASSASTYNGTQTLIDMIQVFDLHLSDANCQAICDHVREQQGGVQNWIKAAELAL